ncbi:conserved hypothetical protein [Phenylobacterium zucineum HLK1]|uniref:Uncharacterized protein n=1 Tax=Phenylobacterium zucineum (strain HLK1) TaxID=450851 RepID=B4RHG1_PHEZH|nr:conserved hypothetical protein [Phenylobacterium zucineum HLK1]
MTAAAAAAAEAAAAAAGQIAAAAAAVVPARAARPDIRFAAVVPAAPTGPHEHRQVGVSAVGLHAAAAAAKEPSGRASLAAVAAHRAVAGERDAAERQVCAVREDPPAQARAAAAGATLVVAAAAAPALGQAVGDGQVADLDADVAGPEHPVEPGAADRQARSAAPVDDQVLQDLRQVVGQGDGRPIRQVEHDGVRPRIRLGEQDRLAQGPRRRRTHGIGGAGDDVRGHDRLPWNPLRVPAGRAPSPRTRVIGSRRFL